MPPTSSPAVLRYYRAVWEQIRRHAESATVLVAEGREDADATPLPVSDLFDPEAFLAAGDGRRVGLSGHWPGRLVLRVRPGDGADIATAATTALELAEQLTADGLVPVAFTDGAGGLAVMAAATGDLPAAAHRYAAGLAERAPELATLDPGQADGRCVVLTQWAEGPVGRPGPVPLPYSLVSGPDGPAPVAPLHLDEIAAVAAGMPLELRDEDVPQRLATRGDLAAALLAGPTA